VPPPQTPTAAGHNSADEERAAGQTTPGPNSPSQRIALDGVSCQPLTLAEAIALAFWLQPRLRASLESIEQARGREDIAFAAFLPTLTGDYSVGGFDLNVGGGGLPVPNLPAFSFIPFTGAVPSGLKIQSGYELAELKLQWLVCDFGRRLARFNQAGLATDIAQLQTERAFLRLSAISPSTSPPADLHPHEVRPAAAADVGARPAWARRSSSTASGLLAPGQRAHAGAVAPYQYRNTW
jgi:outer membrane protein TolC